MNSWYRQMRMSWLVVAVAGCAGTEDVQYLINEAQDVGYYVDKASKIDYPHVEHTTDRDAFARAPHTIADLAKDRIRDMSLEQCVELALQNARIIRSGTSIQSGGNRILSSPNNAPSIYDPAIQETGVLFGGRGVNAALAAFDAQFSTRAIWGRADSIRNGQIPTISSQNSEHTTALVSQLGKTFGYGGQFTLGQTVNYSKDRNPGTFASSYSGNVNAEYRHPLLAGAGTEFTQIAGPISNQFGGLSGVNQGVVISRINHDISLTDFEESLINLLKDVEDGYWNLHLQYRIYDTQVKARHSAQKSWSDSRAKLDLDGAPGFQVEHEPQARDRYFETKALAEEALSELYKNEISLRRLLGLPVNDGEVLRPSDEPLTAVFSPDWAVSVAEGLTHRIEIRRHKWNIKSLELQLIAAESLVRPRLDLIASYQLVGFGDRLLDHGRGQFNSYAGTINDNRHTGWTAGAVFELPIGLRSARTQVQNLELRL
ncbi:MAG: TolC family protein, partial [Planctomycetaceae bacterium]